MQQQMQQRAFGLSQHGTYIGRVWRPGIGPSVVTLRGDEVWDITSTEISTLSGALEQDDVATQIAAAEGIYLRSLQALESSSDQANCARDRLHLLPPCDLQAIKAAGVTFARSMIERVIEERAAGDFSRAAEIREHVSQIIGGSLKDIVPGSQHAMEVKKILEAEGLWSQYLEVGIGPDAEVFTKAQPMSAVGSGARVGLPLPLTGTIQNQRSCWRLHPVGRSKAQHWGMTSICAMLRAVLHCCWERRKTTMPLLQLAPLSACLMRVLVWRM
ncbi:hypothetical protein [Pseudophaeobacter leonis]|uniref:hypothetical protein n=1 Tax=Pseudophaeobacter leonis TaxID=1144477 RepID=UPI0030C65FD8